MEDLEELPEESQDHKVQDPLLRGSKSQRIPQ
jgi:hypothetical protein